MSGCIVLLIDESSLMNAPMPGASGRKIDSVATAVNSLLKQLCGAPVDIGLLGYQGDPFGNPQVYSRWAGAFEGKKFVSARDLASGVLTVEKRVRHVPQPGMPGLMVQQEIEFPIWYVPQLGEMGSKAKAIIEAGQSMDAWMAVNKPVAPPLLLHIVSAIYAQDPLSVATVPLINWMTPAGAPIVLNILLGDNAAAPAIKYPTTDQFLQPGPSVDLFQATTVLPQFMVDFLTSQKETVYPGARGEVYNGKLADLFRITGLARVYAEAVYSVVGNQPQESESAVAANAMDVKEGASATGSAGLGNSGGVSANNSADISANTPDLKTDGANSVAANLSAPGVATLSAPGAANLSAPGVANLSALGVANLSAPGVANLSAPGAANLSAPGAANLSAPGAANLPAPGVANLSAPGAANLSAPGTANLSAPGVASLSALGGESVSVPGKTAPFSGLAPDDSSLTVPREKLLVFLLDMSSDGTQAGEKAWQKRLEELEKQLGRLGQRGQGRFDVSLILYGSDGTQSAVGYPIANKRFVPDEKLLESAIRVETIEKQVPNGVGGLVTLKQKRPIFCELSPSVSADVSVGMAAVVELMRGRQSAGVPGSTLIFHVTGGDFAESTLNPAMAMLSDASLPRSVVHTWVYTGGAHETLKYPEDVEKMRLPVLARLWEQTDPLVNRDAIIRDGKRPSVSEGSRGMVVNAEFDAFFDLFE